MGNLLVELTGNILRANTHIFYSCLNYAARTPQAPSSTTFCRHGGAILEAAARILERKGLDALTTNAVAELAGISIGSLYQYFPGKAVILAKLMDGGMNLG